MATTISNSPAETHAAGVALASDLHNGDVIALVGGLGAGKTHFVKGIVAGLGGNPNAVTSPTFTLVHEYAARLPVYHFDLYRLDSEREVLAIGFDEYLDMDGACIIEWADRFPALLPRQTKWVRFTILEGDQRAIMSPPAAEPS